MANITSIWQSRSQGAPTPTCLHRGSPISRPLSYFQGVLVPDRCVGGGGGVWAGVQGVGKGQEAGQAPRNLPFFVPASPHLTNSCLDFPHVR